MKKLVVLVLVLALMSCATVPAEPEIPEFAREVNGYVWMQMPPQVQIIFLFGFACGQCEMTVWLDKPEAWKELSGSGVTFQQLADGITQYYIQTGRMEDSVLMVHRIIMSLAIEARKSEAAVPGGI